MNKIEQKMDIFKDYYSIGDLANHSGISENSLRIWERRYGKPVPERLASGHRRYPKEQFIWLLKVSEALSLGFKTSKVINATEEELERMLLSSHSDIVPKGFESIIILLKEFDETSILEILNLEYKSKGVVKFCDEFLSSLLSEVGRLWANNELSIRHEHFMTSIIEKFINSLTPKVISNKPKIKKVLICSLEGETHSLGLLMAELVCKYLGLKVVFLGVNTPEDEIVALTQSIKVDVVAISVPLSSANIQTEKRIKVLRLSLPSKTEMIIGSKGERSNRMASHGIHYVKDFKTFVEVISKNAL